MGALLAAARLLNGILTPLLAAGRWIGVLAIAVMVIVILIQVFCRYVLNSALPWPDEAARFCMLWMAGLMAPTAFRAGSFVAIDTIEAVLPKTAIRLLSLFLLCVSLAVLVIAVQIGWKEVNGIGGRFATASLYLPTSISFDSWFRIPRSWMMTSLLVGIALLILVNIELLIRGLARLFGRGAELPQLPGTIASGAE
ncbi:TRAP transporter small permease [Thalassobius sp. MITS945101]|uniref:TRAP transporter small permease n=1 Tax=Thalassobius sp. MITS945101 TaxID=3096994 RepID=UPI00399BDDAC